MLLPFGMGVVTSIPFPEVSSQAHTTVDGMTRSQSEWAFQRLLKEMSGSNQTNNAIDRSAPPVQSNQSLSTADVVEIQKILIRLVSYLNDFRGYQWEDSLDEKYPHIVYEELCKSCDAEDVPEGEHHLNDIEASLHALIVNKITEHILQEAGQGTSSRWWQV
ncbi:hypothetical protein Bca52824_054272 [Brassica carinata]|uniref:Uncharacterized protein n=1 Tax=Brassica carinata TaxID=52824 RepID=A0A8X7ULG5_BRACI|nr:hypothetical protein Bca52824_054272 [Brassica carinata]